MKNSEGRANVELHIEELVLHGFSSDSRLQIGDAVQRELTRLLTEHGLSGIVTGSMDIGQLDGVAFQVGPRATSQSMGSQVANAIHKQLTPRRDPAKGPAPK